MDKLLPRSQVWEGKKLSHVELGDAASVTSIEAAL
jgi:hypothetical protein